MGPSSGRCTSRPPACGRCLRHRRSSLVPRARGNLTLLPRRYVMMGRTTVYLDRTTLDAAARLLGTAQPQNTVERALALALRLGDSLRDLGLGPVQDPAQLGLLDE